MNFLYSNVFSAFDSSGDELPEYTNESLVHKQAERPLCI